MEPRRAIKMYGVSFFALGGLVSLVGTAVFIATRNLLLLVLVASGLLFAVIGGALLIGPPLGRWRRRRIIARGIRVNARVSAIRQDTSTAVGDESPYVIDAELNDVLAGDRHRFTSHHLWTNPTESYRLGSDVTVYYLPGKPSAYAFDLDRLPSPSESIPGNYTQLKPVVPLPGEVEVEESPDGSVRYMLPNYASIHLESGRLEGWSQPGKKTSRPAQRVRQLLVTPLGLTVACDGRHFRKYLVHFPDAPSESWAPNTRWLAAVAQDVARRIARSDSWPANVPEPVVAVQSDFFSDATRDVSDAEWRAAMPNRPRDGQIVEATIHCAGKALPIRFGDARVVQYDVEDGGGCQIQIGVSRANRQEVSYDELIDLMAAAPPRLHLRINGERQLDRIDFLACDDPLYVGDRVAEYEFGLEQCDASVRSVELVWVDKGEHSLGHLPLEKVVPSRGFIEAEIPFEDKTFPLRFGEATVTQLSEEDGAERCVQIGISRGDPQRFSWEELDNIIQGSPHLHFRINDEPTLREVEYWFSGDVSYVGDEEAELPLGLHDDGPVHSVEPVWVDDEERPLGQLPVREVAWAPPQVEPETEQSHANTFVAGCFVTMMISIPLAWIVTISFIVFDFFGDDDRANPGRQAAKNAIQAESTETAIANENSGPGDVNLMLTAEHSASSSDRAPDFGVSQAFDGDNSTRWLTAVDDLTHPWLAAQWDEPVTIRKIVIREAFDRVVDFVVEEFDQETRDWKPRLHVFGQRRISSYQWSSGGTWGYDADRVYVDGHRLEDQSDGLGQDRDEFHPVFTINLPEPLTTAGLRFRVKRANTMRNRRVSISEIEAY